MAETFEQRLLYELESFEGGDEHTEPLRTATLRCWTQLAVERSGVPYDRPVVVLGSLPAGSWYFNGRAVHQLPRAEGVLPEDVEQLRRHLWPSSPAQPALEVTTPVRSALAVHIVQPAWDEGAARISPRLRRYLEQWPVVWNDARCTIFVVPVHREGPQREVVAAWLRPPHPAVRGHSVDVPRAGHRSTDGGIDVTGWAVGSNAAVIDVEVVTDGCTQTHAHVRVERPELGAMFPDVSGASRAGFRAWVDLADQARNNHLKVVASLDGAESVLLGEILVRTVG